MGRGIVSPQGGGARDGVAPAARAGGASDDRAAGEGATLDLGIESIAVGGDGVARDAGGRVVFVPRTAPGDRVRARVERNAGSWARARPVAVLDAGPDRREPPCPWYHGCGGCQLQHLEAVAQREARRRALRDALRRIGGLDVEVPAPVAAGPELGYRNRITLTLRRAADGVVAGYHRWDDPGALIDVDRCPLAEEPVNRAWAALRAAWGPRAEALPATGPGGELRITVRSSREGRVALVVSGGLPGRPGDPDRVASAVPGLASYHARDADGHRRLLAGTATLPDEWRGVALRLRPEAFLQVNRAVAESMDRFLEERAGPLSGRRVLDLYAGVGVRPIVWAAAGARAVGVEAGADAVATGREAAAGRPRAPELREGRVEDLLDGLLPADLVVVNPPRAGLSRPVSRRLAEGGAGSLAYVSCDPATLARDLARLGPAWRVEEVRPFDAFPQTAHVESIAWLAAA